MTIATYPAIPLSQASTFEQDQRVLESQFGDGYSQRAADGINSVVVKGKIVHENITTAELNTLLAFWNTQGRILPFTLTIPYSGVATKMRFVSSLNISALAGDIYNVSVDVIQTFDLTS